MAKGIKATMAAEEREWEAENDLRTLIEAEKVRLDGKRLKAAMRKKRELASALRKVTG